jgi:hypothetical protein
LKILSTAGHPLDATFSVEPSSDGHAVVLESRGPARNTEYTEGLRTLLERLAALDAVLVDAFLDTRDTQRQGLTQEARRLRLPGGASFPYLLAGADADAVVASLKASQPNIGQPPTATGGNDTRRMVMLVRSAGARFPPFLEAVLAGSPRVGVVYVPAQPPSPRNLRIGLERGVWGFSDELMGRSTYVDDFRLLREGDMVFLGHRGPGPRVPEDGWKDATVSAGHLGIITSVEEGATDAVWPDGTYPYRLGIDFLAERPNFTAASVSDEVMEALRLSANQQGRAVVLPLSSLLLSEGPNGVTGPLTLDGPLDRLVARAERREQDKLRKQRLGSATSAPCDLCGRTFPVRYLRMAHIKKRSLCTDAEKLDPNVVMTACIECDALFESHELVVDQHGLIVALGQNDATADLQTLIDARTGKTCRAFVPETAAYFAFHRDDGLA